MKVLSKIYASRIYAAILATIVVNAPTLSSARGAISSSGSLSPANPATWTGTTSAIVGSTADGTLTIDGGSSLTSAAFALGNQAGVTGTATIDGLGSTWINTGNTFLPGTGVYVGQQGNGVLTIKNGGSLSTVRPAYIGGGAASASGNVTVTGLGSTWINSDEINVGQTGNGTLTIQNGAAVSDRFMSSIGLNGNGTATVDGAGSMWINAGLQVGFIGGSGTLIISNGGSVTASLITVGHQNSTGSIQFATGGMLSTTSLYADQAQISGGGTIDTRGLLTDGSLVFDAVHGTKQTFSWNGTTVHLDASGGTAGDLGVGYTGSGALSIRDGVQVVSFDGYLGYQAGTAGVAVVSGAGTRWTMQRSLIVGYSGSGTLKLLAGGVVNMASGLAMGLEAGSSSTIIVDGMGSSLNANGILSGAGSGITSTLSLSNGGRAATGGNSFSLQTGGALLCMTIGDGTSLDLGTGTITNNGIIRLKAGPTASTGVSFTPITAGTWSGVSGTTQALGGTWNAVTHQFTVSPASVGTAGVGVKINQSQTQRILITDPASTDTVGASFLATTGSVTLTAHPLTEPENALLVSVAGMSVLDGWTFSTNGYTTGSPVYLSLDIGSGFSTEHLEAWHFDGTAWAPYAANDLNYDGKYANFTVTGFSGYAVTVAVPEASSLWILAAGIGCVRRKRTW